MFTIRGLEEESLIFKKLLDGLSLPKNSELTVFDASFSDFLIPEYLVELFGYEKIYSVDYSTRRFVDNIKPILLNRDIARTVSGFKCDLFLSLGSAINLSPIFELVHSIHKSLMAGGKFIISVYPDIYDNQGRDILNGLSLISEIPVKERLVRWYTTFKNALNNIFLKVEEDEVLTKIEIRHLIKLFGTHLYRNYLFNSEDEWLKFFHPVAHLGLEYNMSWKILKGFRG